MNQLWIDMEATGLDPQFEAILEVAALVTTSEGDILSQNVWLVDINNPFHAKCLDAMQDVVKEMHAKSRLLVDLHSAAQQGTARSLREIEHRVLREIKPHLTDGKIALAGSGVASYDRQLIKYQMPYLDERLTYWSLDVGVVRRFIQHAGIPVNPYPKSSEPKVHRALPDVLDHFAEWWWYVEELHPLGVRA